MPVEEVVIPELYEDIVIGDRYKLLEPEWTETIGQGARPAGFTYNDVTIPWNSPCVASVECAWPGEVIDGTWHIRAELVYEMRSQIGNDGLPIKQFRKLPS